MGRQRTASPSSKEGLGEIEGAFEQAEQQTLENPEGAEAITALLLALIAAWVAENVPRIYVGGVIDALETLGVDLPDPSLHDAIADSLAQDLLEALEASVSELGRYARARVREVERYEAVPGVTHEPEPFFTDRGGRKWSFSRYATMLVRDATTDIHNYAVGVVGAVAGSPGVRIRDAMSADPDQPCIEANGQAWSISYFLANTKEHPQCTRRGSLLPRGWSGTLDRE